jgi:molecular chaperone DnaK (HSP70)
MRQAMDVKELAEFITSFYDKESGTFPKGPEGVCTMVGKKFGEQAEAVARKFVERMAPHQEQGAEQMQELARIRELSGMRNQQGVDEGSDTVDSIKAKIAELEDEQGENEFGSYAYDTTDAELQSIYAKLDKAKKGMSEGALDELHSDLNDKFNELAPKIEKYKDAQGAKNLYNELMSIAKEHGSEREFERMLDNARHHAHMEYDMNPGGFENWFWHLPLGDNLKDDVSPELEDIRRLSGIAQGIGY